MNKHYFISILVFLLAFTGCMGEDWGDSGGPNIPEHGFILNYSVESVVTRATEPATEQENTINSMFILFFEPSAQGTGKFIDIYIVPLEESVINGEFSSISIDFTDDKYSKLQTSDEYNMLVAANVQDYTRAANYEGDPDDPDYLDELRVYFNQVLARRTENQVIESTYLRLDDRIVFDSQRLPMSGKATKGIEDRQVDVLLSRAVCRIDVINKDPQYELKSASLYNVFPRTTIFGGRFQAYEDEAPQNNYLHTTIDDGNEIKSRLYAYENYVAMPEQNDKQTTCVIVELKKKDANKTYFYRINVSSGDLGQQLKRNNLYKININSVLGNGKSSPDEAYEDSELNISTDVNGWNVDESGIILFDGDNILALPYSQVNFTPAGGVFNCNIFTHGTGVLSITNELLPEGMSVELNGSILTITAGMSDDDLQGMVEVSFGNLVATLTIKQQGDKTEYLEIHPDKVADFPSVPQTENGESQTVSDKIEVDASGAWDAILVCNEPGTFSFKKELGQSITELSSEEATIDGGFSIYLQSSNSETSPKYGFVMITLRSNPKISRVILLTQEASGGIKLSTQAVTFNPFGKNEGASSYPINVMDKNDQPLDMSLWEIKPMSSGYSDFLEEPVKSGNTLIIETKGDNTASTDRNAVFRVYPQGNEANFVELTVIQQHHTLQFSPSGNFGVVPAAGGRTQQVTVTSSSDWEATVTGNGNDGVYFYQETGLAKPTTIDEGKSGDEFSIVFPPAKSVTPPTATVTIKIKGSQVSRTLIFTQKAMETKALNFVGFGVNGNIAGNHSISIQDALHVTQIKNNMLDKTLFGPEGTVAFPGYTLTNQGSSKRTIPEDADIYQTAYTAVTATQAQNIKKWLTKSDKHIYFCTVNDNATSTLTQLKNAEVLAPGYVIGFSKLTAGSPSSGTGGRYLNQDPEVVATKLYEYLVKDGPFTKEEALDPDKIRLYTFTTANSYLTEWPETFIPILMGTSSGGKVGCCFGIDPVNRIIFLGDAQVFGLLGTSSVNYSGSEQAPHNLKLLNNIIAWMTNAALYGDDFIDDFKVGTN